MFGTSRNPFKQAIVDGISGEPSFNEKCLIDYVIVFKKPNYDVDPSLEKKRSTWRGNFTKGLLQQGLLLQTTDGISKHCKQFSFIKVHIPWDALSHFAEIMAIRKPLLPTEVNKIKARWCEFLWNWQLETDVEEPHDAANDTKKGHKLYTSPFSCARQDQFLIEDKDTFFTAAERSMIVHYILNRTVFGRHTSTGNPRFGLNEMIRKGVITAAYPLHSSKVKELVKKDLLLGTLAYFMERCGHSHQLDNVKDYFGDTIAFFACWIDFYTTMLIPVAIVGLGVLSFGLASLGSNEFIKDICDTNGAGNYFLCESSSPCTDCHGVKTCSSRTLAESYCDKTILDASSIVNNTATIFNAIFVTLWTFIFFKLWLRRSAVLQTEWNVRDYEKEEVLRAQFYTLKGERRPHPITDKPEPFITYKEKVVRRMFSMTMIVLIIGALLGLMYVTKLFRQFLDCTFERELIRRIKSVILTSILSLVFVVIFEKMFVQLCTLLTDFEMHRTESDWMNNFRLKYFLFCFANKNMVPLSMGLHRIITKEGLEAMDDMEYGLDIAILLTFYLIGSPVLTFVIDRSYQNIRYYICKKWMLGHTEHSTDALQHEKDFAMDAVPKYILTKYYSDLMVQYGFVTMYAAIYPLAAVCAIIKNMVTMRYLVYYFTTEWRRPVAERTQGIGIYREIVKFITYLSIFINAIMIVMQTPLVGRIVHSRYEKSAEGYTEFMLQKHDNETCRHDYSRIQDDDSCQSTCWYCRHDRVALVLGMSFVVVSLIIARVIDLVSDIPEAQYNELHKESYLAQKVLRQSLTRGPATQASMKCEDEKSKKKSLFVCDNEEIYEFEKQFGRSIQEEKEMDKVEKEEK